MKKFVILYTSLVVIATVVITCFSANPMPKSSLLRQNIEALASGEDVGGMIECYGGGGIYCPINQKAEYKGVVYYQ